MNIKEFNNKWQLYLEDRFYGLAIDDEDVISYLDKEFEREILRNDEFQYSQIKLKFGKSRVYTNSIKNSIWENKINEILLSKAMKIKII